MAEEITLEIDKNLEKLKSQYSCSREIFPLSVRGAALNSIAYQQSIENLSHF